MNRKDYLNKLANDKYNDGVDGKDLTLDEVLLSDSHAIRVASRSHATGQRAAKEGGRKVGPEYHTPTQ
jgi:hypothetical protein